MTAPIPRAPLPVTRRTQLLETLQRDGTVRVSDLVATLGVSPITIRRDIAQLAAEGLVTRVHGGAALVDPSGAAEPDAGGGATGGEPRQVGMLVPSLDYYWPGVVRGAEEAARSHDLRVVLRGSSYDLDDDRRQLDRLLDLGVDALMVAPRIGAPGAAELLTWLRDLDIPVVLVERTGTAGDHEEEMESVVTDHALGAAMAVRHLHSLGHTRIGLVANDQSPHARAIRQGWLATSAELGLDPATVVDLSVPDKADPTWDSVLDRAPQACLDTGTTALLVHADPEAISVAQKSEARGMKVPQDLSIVAYDDEVVSLFSPPMTAVRPPRRSVGRSAVELVAARLADPGRPTHRVLISPSLRVRGTSAAPGGRTARPV
ncbi:MAG TPA: substrate-binding domain-containing protein [Cellulomonas sp.]